MHKIFTWTGRAAVDSCALAKSVTAEAMFPIWEMKVNLFIFVCFWWLSRKLSISVSLTLPIDRENASIIEKTLSWLVKLGKLFTRSEQIKAGVPNGLVGVELSVCEEGEMHCDINSIAFGLRNSHRIPNFVLTIRSRLWSWPTWLVGSNVLSLLYKTILFDLLSDQNWLFLDWRA